MMRTAVFVLGTVYTLTAVVCGYELDIENFVSSLNLTPRDSIYEIGQKLHAHATEVTQEHLMQHDHIVASEYPYFNVFPQHRANILPDTTETSWSASCYRSNVATVTSSSSDLLTIKITSSDPSSDTCSDHYWMLTLTTIHSIHITSTSTDVSFSLPLMSDAEQWDLTNKGVRVMEFLTDEVTTLANLAQTLLLFLPEFQESVGPIGAAKNVDFVNTYPQFSMSRRDPLSRLPPAPHEVSSGDFFATLRLDGLAPMLGFGMGSTTGHTTVAMWIDGELYICESTSKSSFWPTNGIQRTPYHTWMQQAQAGDFNVVWAPLSEESKAKFNATAAAEFFKTIEGFDYGYQNMLWGWIDTDYENYPCLPGDYSSVCLQWELVEPIFGIIDRYIPQISDLMWNAAFNKRLQTFGLSTAELFMTAETRGIATRHLPAIVEQDEWNYNTTRYGEPAEGKAMVCCVFVCNMWRAGGLFDGVDFNCAEMTDADDYQLDILHSEYVQIMGRWTLDLNEYNTRTVFNHMAESCPTMPPEYEKPATC